MEKKEILLDDSFERKTKILDENIEINENLIIDKVNVGPKKQSCLKNLFFAIFPICKKVNTTQRKMVYIKDQYLNYTEWSIK